jgi:hypothetical protein
LLLIAPAIVAIGVLAVWIAKDTGTAPRPRAAALTKESKAAKSADEASRDTPIPNPAPSKPTATKTRIRKTPAAAATPPPSPSGAAKVVERAPPPPPKKRGSSRAKTKRKLDGAIKEAIAKRGLIRADVEADQHTADAWNRWRAARMHTDTSAMTDAADALIERIRSLPFTKSIVDRRLDKVSARLARAAERLPPETLRPLEDRYLSLVSRVGPGLTPATARKLAAEASQLLADVRRADR